MNQTEFKERTIEILKNSAKRELTRLNLLDPTRCNKVTNWLLECYATHNYFVMWTPEVVQSAAGVILMDSDYREFLLNLQAVFYANWHTLREDALIKDGDLLTPLVLSHVNEWGDGFEDSMLNEEVSSQLVTNKTWVSRVVSGNRWYLVFALLMLHVDMLEFTKELPFLIKQTPEQE